ncbi:MAG TPA: hypothetical protein VGQ00_00470 [Candidatus Norongarragalinales archaeon]|jgi:hypothetical protein|nr:hypothetical protein [Candidatus Norongarragalinales archaeon]
MEKDDFAAVIFLFATLVFILYHFYGTGFLAGAAFAPNIFLTAITGSLGMAASGLSQGSPSLLLVGGGALWALVSLAKWGRSQFSEKQLVQFAIVAFFFVIIAGL